VANPDFERIRKSNFSEYFFEPFTDTLKKYPSCEDSFEVWKQGINCGLFMPQFHGREHLNVIGWMSALQGNHKETRLAFDHGLWAIKLPNTIKAGGYQAAFLINSLQELEYMESVLIEGLDLFFSIFGYRASYFAAPNGYFNNILEKTLYDNHIRLINASNIQYEPIGDYKFRRRVHYMGQRNIYNQIYITRNCHFETEYPQP
jgi:hypothetical protein